MKLSARRRDICGRAKRNYAEATRLSILRSRATAEDGRPPGYAAVASRQLFGPKPLAKADPPRTSAWGMLAKASSPDTIRGRRNVLFVPHIPVLGAGI